MKQEIEPIEVARLTAVGIKCDTKGCDYKDMSFQPATPADYAKFLDVPCPVCGAPLLTQADLESTLWLKKTTDRINSIATKVVSILPRAARDSVRGYFRRKLEQSKFRVQQDGSGTVNDPALKSRACESMPKFTRRQ